MNERDVIWDNERFSQKIDAYGTMLGEEKVLYGERWWDKIAPTDYDLVLEIKDKAYIYGEFKVQGSSYADLSKVNGQRLALERNVRDVGLIKSAIGIFVEHNVPKGEDIIARNCIVTAIYIRDDCYSEPRWRYIKEKNKTVDEIINDFLKYYVPKHEEEYRRIRNEVNKIRKGN